MKTIFETCDPRQEVLKGELKEEIFRAILTEVHLNNPEDVYQNPDVFFELTYRTDGLKALLKEALGRLTGVKPSNSSIIRLKTSFNHFVACSMRSLCLRHWDSCQEEV